MDFHTYYFAKATRHIRRMLPTGGVSVVLATVPVLDLLPDRAAILHPVLSCKPPATEKQAITGHGRHLVLLLCFKQDRKSLYFQSLRRSFGDWRFYSWVAGERVFSQDGGNRLYVHGYRCLVSSSCKLAQKCS